MSLSRLIHFTLWMQVALLLPQHINAETQLQKLQKEISEQKKEVPSPSPYEETSPISLERKNVQKAYSTSLDFHIDILNDIDRRKNLHDLAEIKLTKANAFYSQGEELHQHLEKDVNPVWRQLLESSFEALQRKELILSSPRLPPPSFEDNKKTYKQLLERNLKTKQQIEGLIQDQINRHNDLLVRAGILRSMYFKKLQEKGTKTYSLFNPEHLSDIRREVMAIPLHWRGVLFNKVIDYKKKWREGTQGHHQIANDIILLLIIILIPLLTLFIVEKVQKLIGRFKESIVSHKAHSRPHKAMALWLQRLIPFIPWVMYLIALEVAELTIQKSALSEIGLLFPYLRYYFYYKIFTHFIGLTLVNLTTLGKSRVSPQIREKITKSSRISGFYVLVSLILLHTFENVTIQGIVYELATSLVVMTGFFLLFYLAQIWRDENLASINQQTKGTWSQKLTKYSNGPLSYLIGLPIFFMSIFITTKSTLSKWGDEFDISKRVSARFFRKQLESSEKLNKESGEPAPQDYIEQMKSEIPQEEVIKRNFKEGTLEEIKKEIDEWLNEQSEEHSLAIYGDYGIGKSTFLRILESHYKNLNVKRVEIPPKLTTKKQVLDFFSDVLDVDLSDDLSALIEKDAKESPSLILVDKAHNMFLSQVNGFEGYREFINLINAHTENIFWCASFHTFSWRFLDTVFKKNQYFRAVKNIGKWSEEDIRELVLSRHKKTKYQLSYDKILEAARTIDDHISTDYIEEKFFRLLWEQAQGNPHSAIHLWPSALRLEGEQTLKVGLPDTSEQFSPVSNLPDEALFVYTALITHENLTSEEAMSVTNLERGEVNYALKVGLENGILWRLDHKRYQINTLKHASLVSQLRKKNFIYGNR